MRLLIMCPLLCLAMASCVPKPKKNYTAEEIAGVEQVHEVMRVNAHYADPLFALRDNASFSDEQFAQIVDASKMLQASAAHMASKFAVKGDSRETGFYDEGFIDLSRTMEENAKALLAAGEAKNAADASVALNAMRGTCQSCHSIYK
ncbi:MAG: cytochrome c [Polyangiaceae bacterium]